MNVTAQSPPTGRPLEESAAAPRLHYIDGLRGLAMLMVLLYHCWQFGGRWTLNLPLGRHTVNLAAVLSFGHIGVNLFLVLSGFCLYWPFVKGGERREPTLWEFARKRCRRILPPYYVALAIFGGQPLLQAILCHAGADAGYLGNWLWLHALMMQNTQPDYILRVNGSLWSLGLEFQLYIMFPLFVEAYRRFHARSVVLTVFALCTVYRLLVAWGHYTPDDNFGYTLAYSVFGRCFELALGMFAARLVAAWHRSGVSPLRKADFVFIAVVAVLALQGARQGSFQALTDAMWGSLFAGLLLLASRPASLAHRLLSARWIVSLGIFSYSVYLIHLPLVMALSRWGMQSQLSHPMTVVFELGFVLPLMIGLGYLFHLMFERPFVGPTPRKGMANSVKSLLAMKNASPPAV